jgi:hypothetical protein
MHKVEIVVSFATVLFKVEEPIAVRVVIWIVEILLYMIFQSLKLVS